MMANIWWSLPLTLIVFFAARKLAARYKFPLLNPLLVAMVVIIPFLMLTGISYDSYFKGSEVLNDLLQPAVVALAYPLYEQLHQIRARWMRCVFVPKLRAVWQWGQPRTPSVRRAAPSWIIRKVHLVRWRWCYAGLLLR